MYIRHCLLYEFHQDKSVAEAQITICATYGDSFTCHRCSENLKMEISIQVINHASHLGINVFLETL